MSTLLSPRGRLAMSATVTVSLTATKSKLCDDEAVVLSEDVRHDGVEGVQRPHGGLVLVPLVVRTEESRVGLEELHTRVTFLCVEFLIEISEPGGRQLGSGFLRECLVDGSDGGGLQHRRGLQHLLQLGDVQPGFLLLPRRRHRFLT